MADRDHSVGARSALIRFNAGEVARRRLYCLPFAGGGPSTYRLWPRSLPGDIEVVVIVSPGRDPRARDASGHPPPGSMSDLVPAAIAAIGEQQATEPLPYAIFGHSMGALVAYEITVELEHRVVPAGVVGSPEHLFVSGRRPPDELHEGERIHGLADEAFVDAMQRLYGGIPEVVRNEPELMAMLLPGLRADVQVFETYAPLTDRSVACPVHVYGGESDRRPRPELLRGWQRVAQRPISLRTFPGDHFYLDPARAELTADIAAHWVSGRVGPAVLDDGAQGSS